MAGYKAHLIYLNQLIILAHIAPCKGETTYLWHISDFHYDPFYWTTQESCHYNLTAEEQGKYGNYICDPPWELIQSSVEALKTAGPSPVGIIWTG